MAIHALPTGPHYPRKLEQSRHICYNFNMSTVRYLICLSLLLVALLSTGTLGCSHTQQRTMNVTAYCDCSACCSWTRGSWKFLKLNFWNRHYSGGPNKGQAYHGLTARGTKPRQYNPGLFSLNTLFRPWMIPPRLLVPSLIFSHPGTVAADTDYYPFGTTLEIPGYGRGIVEDRGSAIKGPNRLDIYYRSHSRALQWGRQTVPITIKKP
jgi:hypothetical protein